MWASLIGNDGNTVVAYPQIIVSHDKNLNNSSIWGSFHYDLQNTVNGKYSNLCMMTICFVLILYM